MKNLDRKEQRLGLDGGQNYETYVKDKMQTKPQGEIRENPTSAVEMSHTQAANHIHEWFSMSLEQIPPKSTRQEVLDQWKANKRQFVEIIIRILGGAIPSQPRKKQKSAVSTAVRKPKSNLKKSKK